MNSVFEIFKIGVGPSSSHTMGPMVAANRFANRAADLISNQSLSPNHVRLSVRLYGSLALTGVGHATDGAVLAGLSGCLPSKSQTEEIALAVKTVRASNQLALAGHQVIDFVETRDVHWLRNETMPEHPNAMKFQLLSSDNAAEPGQLLLEEDYFSTGGGFVYDRNELLQLINSKASSASSSAATALPYPFISAEELLKMCIHSGLRIDQIIDANERVMRTDAEITEQLDALWDVMKRCIDRGCQTSGLLPGSLRVPRRAPRIFRQLTSRSPVTLQCPSDLLQFKDGSFPFTDPLQQLDWVSLFALAVNEENAAGGKIVTAPTNGAAGVVPAVLAYYMFFMPGANRAGMHRFLKTAAAIGMLYKRNASLSAAEMGCQGEVGVACSMAAAGLAACMNGTIEQIENAAEIGMEHNLGLTCDPVAGLVQVPCIERNTMGATKAINAARLAVLYGDGQHFVSLDRVIETMRQTGVDMQVKYKETSLGGLAVNVVDC
ncbi:MAG: L-serine ammonia-lyase [Pirellula sp.]|jgi:L-serine dehydratase